MTLPELQVLLQALSSFAIAGSLIYTALQFRKQRQVQHVANFTKLVEMQMHLREMRVREPNLAEVYPRDMVWAQGLTGEARDRAIRSYYFHLMQLSVFEMVWFSWRQGQIDGGYFKSWELRMHEVVAEESFKVMWNSPAMKFMHDDFHRYMQGLVDSCSLTARGHAHPER
jgi:hypothetical protein